MKKKFKEKEKEKISILIDEKSSFERFEKKKKKNIAETSR